MSTPQKLDHRHPEECSTGKCSIKAHVEFNLALAECGDKRIKHVYTNKKTGQETYIKAANCEFRTNCRDQCHKAFWYSRYEHQHTDASGKIVPFYMCNFGTDCRSFEHRELAYAFNTYDSGKGFRPKFFYLRKRPDRRDRSDECDDEE